MNQKTVRQSYFRILSRLYDLASEFSVDELKDVQEAFIERGNNSHATVVGSLIEIHNNAAVGMTKQASGLPLLKSEFPSPTKRSSASTDNRRLLALRNLLMIPEVFETTRDIQNLPSVRVEHRPKESRERYIKRVIAAYNNMSNEQKKALRKGIADHVARKSSQSFVSRWTSLIKDL